MNAWLLTWEGTSGPALVPDKKILAILSSRRSSSVVADFVDTLYCRSVDSAYDMALLANKRKVREHQYRHTRSSLNRIFYGRNPCIFARVVINLKVERVESQCIERIRWTEQAVYINAKSGSGIEKLEPERECEHIRSLKPLALDIYE